MKHRFIILALVSLVVTVLSSQAPATVEWNLQKTLELEKPPLHVAVSATGKWIFVLTEPREVLIYSQNGQLRDKITMENPIDHIEAGAQDEILICSHRENKTIQLITLDFIEKIDISGAPFKGPDDAPIAITVFNDYQ